MMIENAQPVNVGNLRDRERLIADLVNYVRGVVRTGGAVSTLVTPSSIKRGRRILREYERITGENDGR